MLFTFFTVHDLIRGEDLLKKNGFKPKILPLPLELTSGCGMGLELEVLDPLEINALLSTHDLSLKGVYREEEGSYVQERV